MTAMVLAFFSVLAGPQQQGADEFAKLVAAVEGFYAKSQDFSAQFEQTVVRVNLPDRPEIGRAHV